MKIVLIVGALVVAAALAWAVYRQAQANDVIVETLPRMVGDADDVGPRLASPVKLRRSFKINCGTVDGGAAVECGVPLDGGTAGQPVPASSIYVAPNAGSTVKVRVGASDVSSSTGFQVGTGARDGVGVTVDAAGCWCKSEGAAQAADVVLAQ